MGKERQEAAVEPSFAREIAIELFRQGGGDVLLDPLRKVCRGRWSRSMIPAGASAGDSGFDGLPDVPGMVIALNIAKRQVRIIDPLGMKQHAGRLRSMNEIFRRGGMQPVAPVPEAVIELRTDKDLATWLYYMRRLVYEWKLAVAIPGAASLGVKDKRNLSEGLPGDPVIDWDSSAFDHPKTLAEYQEAMRLAGRPREAAHVAPAHTGG